MTDGPFRNAQLSSRWKQYGKDLVSDAVSNEERTTQACHSMLGDIDVGAFGSLLRDLRAHSRDPQMDLDPVSSTETIFEGQEQSLLASALQKHLTANLRAKAPLSVALDDALNSIVSDWIGTTKNRLDEECIRARDLGDMNLQDYNKGIERNRETFGTVDADAVCRALESGSKNAFKSGSKKQGIDEGPD